MNLVQSNNNTILFDEPQQNYMKNLSKDKIRQLFCADSVCGALAPFVDISTFIVVANKYFSPKTGFR